MHQQRRLARRRRALERRRGDAHDHPAAVEVGEHVAERRRRRPPCRTRGRPRPGRAWPRGRGRRRAPTTRMSASNVPASVSTRLAAGSIDAIVGLHEPHARLDEVARRGAARRPASSARTSRRASRSRRRSRRSGRSATTSASSPNSSDSRVVSSSPPKPAPEHENPHDVHASTQHRTPPELSARRPARAGLPGGRSGHVPEWARQTPTGRTVNGMSPTGHVVLSQADSSSFASLSAPTSSRKDRYRMGRELRHAVPRSSARRLGATAAAARTRCS